MTNSNHIIYVLFMVFSKTGIIHTRKSRDSRDEGYHSRERPGTYTKEREPLTFREPISYRVPEPKPRMIMANKGRNSHVNGLIPLPETDRSGGGPTDVEKVDFRPKEPREKKEVEAKSYRDSDKKKTAEVSNQIQRKTPRDTAPGTERVRTSKIRHFHLNSTSKSLQT